MLQTLALSFVQPLVSHLGILNDLYLYLLSISLYFFLLNLLSFVCWAIPLAIVSVVSTSKGDLWRLLLGSTIMELGWCDYPY